MSRACRSSLLDARANLRAGAPRLSTGCLPLSYQDPVVERAGSERTVPAPVFAGDLQVIAPFANGAEAGTFLGLRARIEF